MLTKQNIFFPHFHSYVFSRSIFEVDIIKIEDFIQKKTQHQKQKQSISSEMLTSLENQQHLILCLQFSITVL